MPTTNYVLLFWLFRTSIYVGILFIVQGRFSIIGFGLALVVSGFLSIKKLDEVRNGRHPKPGASNFIL